MRREITFQSMCFTITRKRFACALYVKNTFGMAAIVTGWLDSLKNGAFRERISPTFACPLILSRRADQITQLAAGAFAKNRFSHARFARDTEPPEKTVMNHFIFSLCSLCLCVRQILFFKKLSDFIPQAGCYCRRLAFSFQFPVS